MADPTTQELKELILNLERVILGLDRKIDIQFVELKSDIKSVEDRLGGEIKRVEERLSADIRSVEDRLGGEIKRVEERLSADIKSVEDRLSADIRSVEDRLGGEIKRVEEKVSGIDKRIGNEEFISRGALAAVFVSVSAGVIKYLFSSPSSGL